LEKNLKYRGLTINGDTYKRILNGDFNERITQKITIKYGRSVKNIDEHYLFQKARLDSDKMVHLQGRSNTIYGLWILEESGGN
jgi:hypothetical protein